MHYSNGQVVRLGDKVQAGNDLGVVVCSIDSDEYTDQYSKVEWGYLKVGAMIFFEKYGLTHYEQGDDLSLLSRTQS